MDFLQNKFSFNDMLAYVTYADIILLILSFIMVFIRGVNMHIHILCVMAEILVSFFLIYRLSNSNDNKNLYKYALYGLPLCDFLLLIVTSIGNNIPFYLICFITFGLKVFGNGKADFSTKLLNNGGANNNSGSLNANDVSN